jgi:UDP-galactopyranose mutase
MMHNTPLPAKPDIVCLSSVRWDRHAQRPHHLMSRFASQRRVFYVEEPLLTGSPDAALSTSTCPSTGVHVITPNLPSGGRLKSLLAEFFASAQIHRPLVWISALGSFDWLPDAVSPSMIVYDCTGETASDSDRLLQAADLIFTARAGLFDSKLHLRARVHAFPDGVDLDHFAPARNPQEEPADQKDLARPRLGLVPAEGDRTNLQLIRALAERRPQWQFVLLGEPATPDVPNVHWLGTKDYEQLPRYMSGWDLAMMPLDPGTAHRMTAEYLAAGLPVVSTPTSDVMRPFAELGLVRIACTPDEFIAEAEHAMLFGMSLKWRERADRFVKTLSWDRTWNAMNLIIETRLAEAEVPVSDKTGLDEGRRVKPALFRPAPATLTTR